MNELEKLFYEAMKDGRNGFSENEDYEVKVVRTGEKENEIPRVITKKVKIKFKKSGVKVTVPYELFLTNGKFDEIPFGLIASEIMLLETRATICKALSL